MSLQNWLAPFLTTVVLAQTCLGEPAPKRVALLPPLPTNVGGEGEAEKVGKLFHAELDLQPEIECRLLSRADIKDVPPGPLKTFIAAIAGQAPGSEAVILARVGVYEKLHEVDIVIFDKGGDAIGSVWDHGYPGPNGNRFDRVGRDDLAIDNAFEYLVANVLKALDHPSPARPWMSIAVFDDTVTSGDYAEGSPAMLATAVAGEWLGLARPGPLAEKRGGPVAKAIHISCDEAKSEIRGRVATVEEVPTLRASLHEKGKEIRSASQAFNGVRELRTATRFLAQKLLSTQSDRLLWSFKAGGAISGSPIYRDGAVYFTAADEHLYAVNVGTGELQQKVQVEHSIVGGPVELVGPVLLADFIVALTTGGSVYGYVGKTLKPAWVSSASPSPQLPALTPEGLIIVHGNNVSQLSEDVKIRWAIKADGTIPGAVVAGDRFFYGSADQRFHAKVLSDGKPFWSVDTEDRPCGTPAADESSVYFGTDDGQFHAVSRADGKRQWSTALPDSAARQPLIAGDLLLVPVTNGSVYGIERKTGKIVGERKTGSRGAPSLRPAKDAFLLATPDGLVESWKSLNEPALWSFRLNSQTLFPPLFIPQGELAGLEELEVADSNLVIVGDSSGNVYALDAGERP